MCTLVSHLGNQKTRGGGRELLIRNRVPEYKKFEQSACFNQFYTALLYKSFVNLETFPRNFQIIKISCFHSLVNPRTGKIVKRKPYTWVKNVSDKFCVKISFAQIFIFKVPPIFNNFQEISKYLKFYVFERLVSPMTGKNYKMETVYLSKKKTFKLWVKISFAQIF